HTNATDTWSDSRDFPRDKFISATATDKDNNTSEFSMVDTDGDGIPDEWEKNGIDINEDGNIDLKLNSDPNHKDVFVEIDAMMGLAPAQSTIDLVVDAFKIAPNDLVHNPDEKKGVTLHATVDDRDILPDPLLNGLADLSLIKKIHFGTSKEQADP